jgi:hypothetical protein
MLIMLTSKCSEHRQIAGPEGGGIAAGYQQGDPSPGVVVPH